MFCSQLVSVPKISYCRFKSKNRRFSAIEKAKKLRKVAQRCDTMSYSVSFPNMVTSIRTQLYCIQYESQGGLLVGQTVVYLTIWIQAGCKWASAELKSPWAKCSSSVGDLDLRLRWRKARKLQISLPNCIKLHLKIPDHHLASKPLAPLFAEVELWPS